MLDAVENSAMAHILLGASALAQQDLPLLPWSGGHVVVVCGELAVAAALDTVLRLHRGHEVQAGRTDAGLEAQVEVVDGAAAHLEGREFRVLRLRLGVVGPRLGDRQSIPQLGGTVLEQLLEAHEEGLLHSLDLNRAQRAHQLQGVALLLRQARRQELTQRQGLGPLVQRRGDPDDVLELVAADGPALVHTHAAGNLHHLLGAPRHANTLEGALQPCHGQLPRDSIRVSSEDLADPLVVLALEEGFDLGHQLPNQALIRRCTGSGPTEQPLHEAIGIQAPRSIERP
mmetsp:Transcript_36343/g.93974  ORF Transcript_36343/g.93974 Transcript_36343/m.93974 type:complete len:286 (+) Transcript_36343:1879-2736(+)